MDRSVHQALSSLIPKQNNPLPSELLELASSLLAQSRNRASTLNAQEEIGRTYACANIACERLKQQLNLPTIEPLPPCPPRVYKKLYTYLDKLLVAQKRRQSNVTPKRSKANPVTPRKSVSKVLATTPMKDIPTPLRAHRRAKKGLLIDREVEAIPGWVHPMIRLLCKEFEAPVAAHHILAGITTILTLPVPFLPDTGTKLTTLEKKDQIPALIAALFFLVSTRLRSQPLSGKEFLAQRKAAMGVLSKGRVSLEEGGKIRDWSKWQEVSSSEIDSWVMQIIECGWLRLDWYENIVEGSGLQPEDGHTLEDDDDFGLDDEELRWIEARKAQMERREALRKGHVQTGLGTMLQDQVDFLTDAKRNEFQAWKEGVMRKMKEIEDQGLESEGPSRMCVVSWKETTESKIAELQQRGMLPATVIEDVEVMDDMEVVEGDSERIDNGNFREMEIPASNEEMV